MYRKKKTKANQARLLIGQMFCLTIFVDLTDFDETFSIITYTVEY